MKEREKGITLIALVITIIILLILAGVSISALTGSGLFKNAKEAEQKSENVQAEENSILKDYESAVNEYLSGTEGSSPEEKPVTLASKVKIGDYVKYIPDEVNSTDTAYTSLISELTTYSGNTDTTQNISSTVTQDSSLNWRVLDKVKDENGNDCIRLISAMPTTSTLRLEGYNGYNNAVYLIDKTCSILYNNSKYAKKVQNLKIEDIETYMKTKPTYSDDTISPITLYYPSILAQEKNQTITIGGVTTTGTLGLSEQFIPIKQTDIQQVTSWNLKITNYSQIMTSESFTDAKYYSLFIADENENNYSTYWMSSRYIYAYNVGVHFCIRNVKDGNIYGKRIILF